MKRKLMTGTILTLLLASPALPALAVDDPATPVGDGETIVVDTPPSPSSEGSGGEPVSPGSGLAGGEENVPDPVTPEVEVETDVPDPIVPVVGGDDSIPVRPSSQQAPKPVIVKNAGKSDLVRTVMQTQPSWQRRLSQSSADANTRVLAQTGREELGSMVVLASTLTCLGVGMVVGLRKLGLV